MFDVVFSFETLQTDERLVYERTGKCGNFF